MALQRAEVADLHAACPTVFGGWSTAHLAIVQMADNRNLIPGTNCCRRVSRKSVSARHFRGIHLADHHKLHTRIAVQARLRQLIQKNALSAYRLRIGSIGCCKLEDVSMPACQMCVTAACCASACWTSPCLCSHTLHIAKPQVLGPCIVHFSLRWI